MEGGHFNFTELVSTLIFMIVGETIDMSYEGNASAEPERDRAVIQYMSKNISQKIIPQHQCY